jgi:ElaB/YqjD/DUF883 family membrane-anchored ribosome-binding protein
MASVNNPAARKTDKDSTLNLSDTIQGLKDELARLTEQVQTSISDGADYVKKQASDAAHTAQDTVRENPLSAVGVAFGVGLVVGLMLPRRRPPHYNGGNRSYRELNRLANTLHDSIDATRSRAYAIKERASDPALLDRLTGLATAILENSRSTASSLASAGERTAKTIANKVADAVR